MTSDTFQPSNHFLTNMKYEQILPVKTFAIAQYRNV